MKRPVLILGFIPRIVITIARSLHRYGIPVDVADFMNATRLRSYAVRNYIRLPYAGTNPEGFVRELRAFITQQGHDFLIPADDSAMSAVVQHYEDLKDLLYIACPPPDVTALVLNKAATLDLAQKCGIRVPKTVLVTNSNQLRELAKSVPLPWILKPSAKQQRKDEFKTCLLKTPEDIGRNFPSPHEFDPPMLLQEYCQGAGVGVEMLMEKSECVALFQHRRLQELPFRGGFAVTAVAERPNPSLVQSSLSILRAAQWSGVAMVEFKVDGSGQAVLMEVNGRYWGTISLPIMAGVDFPLYHWKLAHGERPVTPTSYAIGMKWRWTTGCIARFRGLLAGAVSTRETRAELWRTLLQLPSTFDSSMHDAIFSVSDPMPAVFELLSAMKFYVQHDFEALLKRSREQFTDASPP